MMLKVLRKSRYGVNNESAASGSKEWVWDRICEAARRDRVEAPAMLKEWEG